MTLPIKPRKKVEVLLAPKIAVILRAKRRAANISKASLGRALKYGAVRPGNEGMGISAWEAGRNTPSLGSLYLLAAVYDCPITDFLPPVNEVLSEAGLSVGITEQIKRIPQITEKGEVRNDL